MPHFLFNCLNTLRGMILEDPRKAQDMVTRLAGLLRYNLKQDSQTAVPLETEVEIASDYLALELIRFEERLRVSFSIDPAAAQTRVPALLLQTLVENAVKHGISHLPQGGEVAVRATRQDGALELVVENTGSLRSADASGTQKGLALARERLRLMYGERARLDLTEPVPGRVAAVVTLPATL
jgi:LytS/YehU family sensor histidine kinase